MNSRSSLVFVLILSLAIVPGLQLVLAASPSSTSHPYSEQLDIYTAGSNTYSFIKLSPVNATKPSVVAAESVAGLNSYELTAIKTTTATAGSELFWSDGYRILKLPFIPDSGVFLNVSASSQSAAQSAVSDFDVFLGTNFGLVSSSGSNYTYFSPADFTIAGKILFLSVPTQYKGLGSIMSGATLSTQSTPTVVLTGVRSGSSFTHTFTFGSTQAGAVDAGGNFNLAKALNQQNATFTSSPNATSTQINVHSLDGLISSSDSARISNHESNFSASYSVNIPANRKFSLNVSLLQDPPVLTATRILDRGAANQGDLVSVTFTLRNTAQNGALQNIAIKDDWWTSYPSLFSLSAGNSSIGLPSLAAGQNVSRVYVLKVLSTTSQDIIVPAASVTYTYGSSGDTVQRSTVTNQVELRTNNLGPALSIQAASDTPSGSPLGKLGHYLITVTNLGSAPALNLNVGDLTNPNLVQNGGTWKFNTTLPLTSIVNRNVTATFTVNWTAPDGSKGTLVSNPVNVVLSHTGVLLPLSRFNLAATLTYAVLASGNLNATYTLTNKGNGPASQITVSQPIAAGMACKNVLKGNATCGSSTLSLTVPSLAAGSSVTGSIQMTFSNDNYLTPAAAIVTNDAGLSLHTAGAAFLVPAGVLVTKTFTTNPVFQQEDDMVKIQVTNRGSLPVFNVSASTGGDGFDQLKSGTPSSVFSELDPNTSQSFNYTVGIVVAGNHTTSAVALAFDFAGSVASYTGFQSSVLVYKQVQATTTTKPPTPVEGADFSLVVNVLNPSAVNVTNISLSIPLPQSLSVVGASGLTVNGRTLTLAIPSLGASSNVTRSVTLKAAADGNIDLGKGNLTFQYMGTTIRGVVVTPTIVVGVDLLLRYEVPIALGALLMIGAAVYIHRKLSVPQATEK